MLKFFFVPIMVDLFLQQVRDNVFMQSLSKNWYWKLETNKELEQNAGFRETASINFERFNVCGELLNYRKNGINSAISTPPNRFWGNKIKFSGFS